MQGIINKRLTTQALVKISVLAVLSFLLMMFEFPIPIFPGFLQLDFSDLPAIIGTISLGPVAGIFIELVKNLLHFVLVNRTGGIGEVANFVVGIALVIPIGLACRKSKSLKNFLLGAFLGTTLMIIVACIMNYFVLIPMYSKFMPIETIVAMANEISSLVVDLKTLVIFAIAPFNLLKAVIVSFIGFLVFRSLKSIL